MERQGTHDLVQSDTWCILTLHCEEWPPIHADPMTKFKNENRPSSVLIRPFFCFSTDLCEEQAHAQVELGRKRWS